MTDCDIISFSELYTMDFEITDVFAMRQRWKTGAVFNMDHPRKSTAILFLNGCVGEYYCADGVKKAPCKSLVCIPMGSEYKVLNADCGLASPDAYMVEFNIVKDGKRYTLGASPYVIDKVNAYIASELTLEAVKAYESALRSPSALKAAVYKLIAFLGKEEHSGHERFSSIKLGIELLEYDGAEKRSIDEIAELCGVSGGCFRRLFKEYSGKTPSEYRTGIKLDRAKNMLRGSSDSIESIADALDFDGSAYFCRVFKKNVGITPTEYRNQNR